MIIAYFDKGYKYATVSGLFQYDYGRILQIQGLRLPTAVEVHFSLSKTGGESVTRVGTTKDRATNVLIPDSMLENNGITNNYKIYVFIYLTDETSGQTEYCIEMEVKSRPKPEAFNKPEDAEIFREAIKAVNDSATRAETAKNQAGEYAQQTRLDAQQTTKDREEIESLVKSTENIKNDVEIIRQYKEQTETASKNALLSESGAKKAETSAIEAKNISKQYALQVTNDKTEVERLSEQVKIDKKNVEQNKQIVEQKTQDFVVFSQQAVESVSNVGQEQINRIQSVGNEAVSDIHTIQGLAETKIQETGQRVVSDVQTEGEKQLATLQDETVQFLEDRKQIQKNKTDIQELTAQAEMLAPAIIETASGENVVVKDSAERRLQGLNIYGKSTQQTTTGAQLLDVSKLPTKSQGGVTVTNNGDGSFTVSGIGIISETINYAFDFNHEQTVELLKCGNITLSVEESLSPHFDVLIYANRKFTELLTLSRTKVSTEITEDMINAQDLQLRFRFYANSGETIKGGTIKPMLYQDGDGTWEQFTGGKPSPSPEYPQEIKSAGDKGNIKVDVMGKNLCSINAFEGISSEIKSEFIPWNKKKYIYIRGKFKKKISNNLNTIYLRAEYYDASKKALGVNGYASNDNNGDYKDINTSFSGSQSESSKEIDLTQVSFIKIIFGLYKDMENQISGKDIMVSDDPILDSNYFESYRPFQSLILQTPNGLPGIKVNSDGNYTDETGQQWICDEIDLERGKYVQRVKKCIFNGSDNEKWGIANSHLKVPYSFILLELNSKRQYNNNILCNRAMVKVWDTDNVCFINEFNKFVFYDSKITSTVFEDVNNFKAWLVEHPIEIVYEISEPIETDLPPEIIEAYKQLHTNYPTTTVMNDVDAGMDATYIADTKLYVDNKIKGYITNINTQLLKGV